MCGAEKTLAGQRYKPHENARCLKPIHCPLYYRLAGALHKISESTVLLNQLQWLTSFALMNLIKTMKFLSEIADYLDTSYYTTIWLSSDRVLLKFLSSELRLNFF